MKPSDYPPPFDPNEFVVAPGEPEIEVGVLIVGAGPAGLACAIRLGQLLDGAPELAERLSIARSAGCYETWVDPGIGFGKRLEHNLALLHALSALHARLDVPVMVGVSRKAFIGQLTGKPAGERLFGTAAAVTVAVMGGAAAVRVHDVAEMRDVVRVAEAMRT